MRLRLSLALCLAIPVLPAAASAQDTPAVFIHGLASHAGTWTEAANALQQQLTIEAHRPDPDWRATFGTQTAQVQSEVGFLSSFSIAVCHSNGGLVAREWSKTHPLYGLVTLGTPNHGAPFVDHILEWSQITDGVYYAFGNLFGMISECNISWECYVNVVRFFQESGLSGLVGLLVDWITSHPLQLAASLGLEYGAPVIFEMAPSSAFIQGSIMTTPWEQTQARIGIVSTAHNFFPVGWYRAIRPESGDIAWAIRDSALTLTAILAGLIEMHAEPWDWEAEERAETLRDIINAFYNLDYWWCRMVSSSSGGYCEANDTIVPVSSQMLPLAHLIIPVADGPAHTQETTNSNQWIYQALANHLGVPPRPGAASSAMQADSAIRGCSGWSWWNPVYRPSADSCYEWCVGAGADACEYSVNGDCYVEFGDGCGVQSGFPGWSAAVITGGGGPRPGGGTWHDDSAVRGCSAWTWWDPVYAPDTDACRAFCEQNGADACEWYETGDCYVEFGSGCGVASGYPGWHALVLH